MHVGVAIFPTEYAIPMAELARAAEERGFESLWVSEHSHIPVARRSPWPGGPDLPKMYYDTLDPFVALASAASVTSHIRLATGICLIVERDPIHTAKQVASLDRVSGGRFLFGIGAGWNLEEMENHGTRPETRFRLMRERVEAMKAIWSRDEAEYHGEFVDFDPIFMWPKPIQAPHPPIHVGGGFPGGARRAIRYGDGWMPISGRDGDIAQRVAEFREMAAQAGRDPRELEVSVFGAEPERAALVRYRDAGVSRAILRLPSAPRDEILPLLDGFASAMQSTA
ncbi:MAG TPA: LLM class F420-dependent oxidoreductase [Myxococcota bacterium]|nr:LLM class F420-dependent oxidoreductase [Myxococcota bacterium]